MRWSARVLVMAMVWLVLCPVSAHGEGIPRIAVLELEGKTLDAEMRALLSDKVRAGVLDATRGQRVMIMSRENMASIAKDMGLDLSCVEGECEVETGRNLGADFVLSGVVVHVRDQWVCTLKLHQTTSGELLATADERSADPLDLMDQVPAMVVALMGRAFGGGGSGATMQLGGDDVDFAGRAADAQQDGAGGSGNVGAATLELGTGGGDIASLARRAAAKKAEREHLDRQRQRLEAEEAELQAAMEAERRRRLESARDDLLDKAHADLRPLQALLNGPMSDSTMDLLNAYIRRYTNAKVKVNDQTASVVVPGVATVQKALKREERRREEVARAERARRIQAAKQELLAKAAEDYAAIKPLLGTDTSAESREALNAFLGRYGDARIRVDNQVERVSVPGVAEVRRTLDSNLRDGAEHGGSLGALRDGSELDGVFGSGGIGRIGGDPIILGALDKSLIDRVIKRNMNQIRYCYARELTQNPNLGGKITVKFVIAGDGTVIKVSTKKSTMGNSAVESCINTKFMRFVFPVPKGGGLVIVSYPFIFAPG